MRYGSQRCLTWSPAALALWVLLIPCTGALAVDDGKQSALERLRSPSRDQRLSAIAELGRGDTEAGQAGAALIPLLKHDDWYTAAAAADALAQLKYAPALEPLMLALEQGDFSVRIAAAKALGELGDPRAMPALVNAATVKEWGLDKAAAEALRKIGAQQEGRMADLLASTDDPALRWTAAVAVVRSDPAAAAQSRSRLDSPDLGLRRAAVAVLAASITSEDDLPRLMNHSEDVDSQVRLHALQGLARIGGLRGGRAVVNAMNDSDAMVREAAAALIEQRPDPRALPAMVRRLASDDTQIVLRAVRFMAAVRQPAAVPPLARLLRHHAAEVRLAAMKAIATIGGEHAVAVAAAALRDGDADVRHAAMEVLRAHPDRRVVPAILEALGDSEVGIVLGAVEVLAKLRDGRAVEPLRSLATHDDPSVRSAAAAAIEAIEGP